MTHTNPTAPDARLAALTRAQKIALVSGQNFWEMHAVPELGLPAIMLTDGPHGVRKQASSTEVNLDHNVLATCFPTASALASSWDRDLIQRVGVAIGAEARAKSVSVVLGPGVNIKRSPLGGRNFEYFSEDPFLSSHMAAAYIHGVQSQGVGTSIKHFAANNQEYRRMTIDTHVDERALREIYLASFEHAVIDAQPWTVMCSYNAINGTLASQNRRLLTDVLRTEWGFAGVVVSDWGAVYQRVPALNAGLDLEMPGNGNIHAAAITAALADGSLPEAVLDQRVSALLDMIEKALPAFQDPGTYDHAAHHALARRAAADGAVLLKNDTQLLPIATTQRIAVIGSFAKTPRYQGAGSSMISPHQIDTFYDALVARVGADGSVSYAEGYTPRAAAPDADRIAAAVAVARAADIVVVCAGLPDVEETEGLDRQHMRMPEAHNALIAAVVAVNPRTVVVLSNGAPVEMPWHDQVPAILEGYLGGQAGGSGLVDILVGDVTPSGKLAETIPFTHTDHPAHVDFPGSPTDVEYRESIYVGYRYYNTAQTPVRYPFGYGLSYTTFAYSTVTLNQQSVAADDGVDVSLTITNTGTVAGAEVVQVYVHDQTATVFKPTHELKAYAKVHLQPGASQQVTFHLPRRAFAHYDVAQSCWVVESGAYDIHIGASSRDIRQSVTVDVASTDIITPSATTAPMQAYWQPSAAGFSATSFSALWGGSVPTSAKRRGSFTTNTPIADMHESMLGRLVHAQVRAGLKRFASSDTDGPTNKLFEAMAEEAPLRVLLMSGGGKISNTTLEVIVAWVNGHYLRAIRLALANRFR